MKMSTLGWISFVLVIVGALNWGLVGLFGFDLVATVLGAGTTLARAVYILVGLGAIYMIVSAASMKE